MPTNFYATADNVETTTTGYTAGSGSIALAADAGASFGTPSPTAPVVFSTFTAGGVPGGIYRATGRTNDTLTGLTLLSGTDTTLPSGAIVSIRWTDAHVDQITTAIAALETAPPTHSHITAEVTGLDAALAGKAASVHTHDDRYYTEAELDGLLAAKAALASPALTGTPTAPTAANGTSTTQLATTAFVLANTGSGSVTSVSVATANGLAGTVATATTTPAITLTTSVTGLVKGNGTALSAAVAGTDYLAPTGSGAALTEITHAQLSGLTTGDPHTQYALLAGRPTGQNHIGKVGFNAASLDKASRYQVTAVADDVLTGTTTVNASTTVTGVGTSFLSEVGIGDRISVSSASTTYREVTGIASNTSLTVASTLGNGTSQTINVKRAIARFDSTDIVGALTVDNFGTLTIKGNNNTAQTPYFKTTSSYVGTTNAFSLGVTGTGSSVSQAIAFTNATSSWNFRHYGSGYTDTVHNGAGSLWFDTVFSLDFGVTTSAGSMMFKVSFAGLTIGATTTGTPTVRDVAVWVPTWATTADATRKGRVRGLVHDATAGREYMRAESNGSAAMLGFYGATAVVKAAAPTAADAGTINTGDATSDAVIANMRTRIGELETALRSLGLIT